MRWLIVVACMIVPAIVLAKPSVAVAPLDGDDGNKVGNAVAKAIGDEASSVTGPKDTGKAMKKLDLSGELSKSDRKKLRGKLDVDVLIYGKVDDDGSEKSVSLTVTGKGLKSSKLKLRFKKATSPKFKNELSEALAKRLSPGEADEDDDEAEERKKREAANEEERQKKKKHDDDEEETRKKKKRDDDEEETRKKKKRVSDEDDNEDGPAVRKKKKRRRSDDEDETPRHAVTQAAIRLNAGAGYGRRGLDYDASGANPPPPVGTAAPSGRVEVELYPGATSTLKGAAAGFGIYGDYDMTFGVSIAVPGSGGKSASISQSHYQAGVRYRFAFGQNTIALGVGYAARKYTADRSGLGMGVTLDMPDVKYRGIAPNIVGRFAATPSVGVFAGATFLLLMDAGPIATNANFGYAKTLAFEGAGGADIALGKGYGLRLAVELSQVGLTFRQTVRGVSAATDRTIGAVATFEVLY